MKKEITFVLTSCNRFDLLVDTVESFLECNTYPIKRYIITEDSGNVEMYEKIKKRFGKLFDNIIFDVKNPRMQTRIIDRAYSSINTEYIFHCFKGRTLIETKTGAKQIRDIKRGDYVKTHKGKFKKVVKTFKHYLKQRSPLLWLKTPFSLLKVTPEHPFLVMRGSVTKWIKANNIRLSDFLLYPINTRKDRLLFNCQSRWHNFGTINVNKKLAKFMGLYLAEGNGGHDSIRFTFGNHEKMLHKFIINFCKTRFKRKPTVNIAWATQIKLNISSFGKRFIQWFGKKAREKRIPLFVFKWNVINRLAFIEGYILGDGYLDSSGVVVVTASRQLVKDFIRLCNSCGLAVSNIEVRKPTISKYKGRVIKGGECYAVRLCKYSWGKLQDVLKAEQSGNYCIIPLVSKEEKKQSRNGGDMNVYNLEVEGDNSFIANSVAVHNCEDDWHFHKKGNFIEQAIEVLEYNPRIIEVWLRDLKDLPSHKPCPHKVQTRRGTKYHHVFNFDESWAGFSLNPNIKKLSDYKIARNYSRFITPSEGNKSSWVMTEKAIARFYSKLGYIGAWLGNYCFHTGGGRRA